MFIAINEEREKSVGGKQPGPQKQRALLSGPQSGELVVKRQRAVAVRSHVSHRKIIGEKIVLEARHRKGDEYEYRHSSVARTLSEESLAGYDAYYAGADCVHGSKERQ